MRPIATPAGFLAVTLCASASFAADDGRLPARTSVAIPKAAAVRSQSGQFLVYPGKAVLQAGPRTNTNLLRLEPALLAISCERIKQTLARDLALTRPWRGKVLVALYTGTGAGDPITLTAERFRDTWQYRLELPDQIERQRYVRAMVQAVLLEIANQNAPQRSAEIPLWLSEGFAERLLASSEIGLLLPAQRPSLEGVSFAFMNVKTRRQNPLENAHLALSLGPAVSFEQLSWPEDENTDGETTILYRSGAQLLIHELLRLKDGRECLQSMLAHLPETYNWQFAFLRAFDRSFRTPLEVEKWWALRLVNFTGRELAQTWPVEESWAKLNEVVHPSVQIRVGTNELPLHSEVTLQLVIRQWDQANQTQTLQGKLRQLEAMRLRVAEELLPVLEGYRLALEHYLQQRDKGLLLFKKRVQNRVTEETLQRLDELDDQLLLARPGPKRAPVQAVARE